jgi:nitrite reductase (NADH) small subunit
MSDLVLMSVSDIPLSGAAEVVAEGRIFAVFRNGSAVHVIDGLCAHAGGPLGKGTLVGDIVTCPWHGWQYDVRTGQNCLNPRICQQSFPCRILDGMVVIQRADGL